MIAATSVVLAIKKSAEEILNNGCRKTLFAALADFSSSRFFKLLIPEGEVSFEQCFAVEVFGSWNFGRLPCILLIPGGSLHFTQDYGSWVNDHVSFTTA